MRPVQVGSSDLVGNRFNGQDVHKILRGRGIESAHIVWDKHGSDPDTYPVTDFRYRHWLQGKVNEIEMRLSIQSLLQPFGALLPFHSAFRNADVVHYHLIHTGYFSMAMLPLLTAWKPSVWTLHDPWAMTGHCIYPYDCDRWKTGCGDCPNLKTPITMYKDRTAAMWKVKNFLYACSKINIVVASNWMRRLAEASPLISRFPIHHIPFGLDLEKWKPGDAEARKRKLGVFPGNVVLGLRSMNSEFKGLKYILEAMEHVAPHVRLTLLSFNELGHLDHLLGRHQVIELGWVSDDDVAIDAYQASDMFLMPSTAEAFGMMAMEAMACGKPSIVFEGTSLPEVACVPEAAIAVPMRDSRALAHAISALGADPERRLAMGRRARELAEKHYSIDRHVGQLIALYESAIARRRGSD